MPTEPDRAEELTNAATREATALVGDTFDHLRAARDFLDEASQVESLPPEATSGLMAYEAVVNALVDLLKTTGARDYDEQTILDAIRALLEPTQGWTDSMMKLERHLSEQSGDDQAGG